MEVTPYRISGLLSPVLGHLQGLLSVTRAEGRTEFNETTVRQKIKKKRKSQLRSTKVFNFRSLGRVSGAILE